MRRLLIAFVIALLSAGCASSPTAGLSLEKLSGYDAVMVEPVTVEFSSSWEPLVPGSHLPLGEAARERVRKLVADTFDQRFSRVLDSHGVRLVDSAGDSVLRIRPVLQDVIVNAPNPNEIVGNIYIRNVGSMNLRAEFADSVSNELLLVLEDRHQGRQSGFFHPASDQYNRQRLAQVFGEWAEIIAEDMLLRSR